MSEKDANYYREKYGEIIDAEIIYYYKYAFGVFVKTEKGYQLKLSTGGGSDDIYKYDPFGGWDEHSSAGIDDITEID